MTRNATLLALLATQLLAFAAFGQTEYGRSSGGEVRAITKDSSGGFSGSLGFMTSIGGGNGYEGSLGGSLMNDRLWFFASAQRLPGKIDLGSNFRAVDAKATAQPVDWSNVTASFSQTNGSFATTPFTSPLSLPSSFLSLRSTSMVRSNMVFDISVTRQTTGSR